MLHHFPSDATHQSTNNARSDISIRESLFFVFPISHNNINKVPQRLQHSDGSGYELPATHALMWKSGLNRKERLQGLGKDGGDGSTIWGLNGLVVLCDGHQQRPKPSRSQKILTSPHHGPAAHQRAPIQTPDCCIKQRAPWIASIQSPVGQIVRSSFLN